MCWPIIIPQDILLLLVVVFFYIWGKVIIRKYFIFLISFFVWWNFTDYGKGPFCQLFSLWKKVPDYITIPWKFLQTETELRFKYHFHSECHKILLNYSTNSLNMLSHNNSAGSPLNESDNVLIKLKNKTTSKCLFSSSDNIIFKEKYFAELISKNDNDWMKIVVIV